MRWLIVALCALSACDMALGLREVPSLPGAVGYRKPITIAQDTPAPLMSFPVSVVIAADADLAAHAAQDGSDLVFSDGATELPAEIVAYDASGSLEAWVVVPELPPGQTTIYLGYGGGSQRQRLPSQVWAGAYAGVWHTAGSGGSEAESTSHGHGLTVTGAPVPASVPGVVGAAREFSAVAGEQLCGADGDGSLEFDATASVTYEVWLSVATAPTATGLAVEKGGASGGSPGVAVEVEPVGWKVTVADAAMEQSAIATGGTTHAWTQLVGVVDRTSGQLLAYADGALTSQLSIASLGSLASTAEPLCLGGDHGGSYAFAGDIDEISIAQLARPANWIHFEYENLAQRDRVITVGREQTVTARD